VQAELDAAIAVVSSSPQSSEIGLDVKKEEDLIIVAQFHVNERPSRHTISHEPTGSIG